MKPDILLLDEPTNHLDFPAVDWLISYLKVYDKTCVIVSHDRGFLNNVITDVLDMHDQVLDYYKGDYDTYVKTRDEHQKLALRNYEKQVKQKEALRIFIEEAKRSKNPQTANMAASRQKALDKIETLEPPKFEKPWSFTFPDPGKLEHPLVSIIDMNFGWDKNKPEKLQLRNVNGFVDMKSRIGVLGANGAGKTTLINLILGKLQPWNGTLRLNEQARTIVFTQHHMDLLDMNETPLEHLQRLFPKEKEQRIRGFLGHFGFDKNLIEHKIGTLSGGQKSRVAFAVLSWNNPHCIIMDEPTNHLDLQTVEALATSLKTFEGGVILVSHDIYFLSQVAETFWAVNSAGEVKEFFDLDEAKLFSYKPIQYKPISTMKEETAEVKAAFAAQKAEEQAKLDAEIAKRLGDAEKDDEDPIAAHLASLRIDDNDEQSTNVPEAASDRKGGPRKKKNKKGNKGRATVVDMASVGFAGLEVEEPDLPDIDLPSEEEEEPEEEEEEVEESKPAQKSKKDKKKDNKKKKNAWLSEEEVKT